MIGHLRKRLFALLLSIALLGFNLLPALAGEQALPAGPARPACGLLDKINILSIQINPAERYMYLENDSILGLLGFNKGYDLLGAVLGFSLDTMRCKFSYEGRDWLIQLWKGGYVLNVLTGGEVGIYSKPASRKAEHYDAVPQEDWMGLEFTVYFRGEEMFSRPMETCWWQTGFQLRFLPSFRRPHADVVFEAGLCFTSEGMARAFAQAVEEKGFIRTDGGLSHPEPERYTIEGATVRLMWGRLAESLAD